MKKKLLSVLTIAAIALFAGQAYAQQVQITFPINELGGCTDQSSCKAYCDVLEHAEACTDFAVAHGLITQDQASASKKFIKIKTGPGGCSSKDDCEKFCSDAGHMDECIQFAKEHGLVPDDQIQKMQKFKAALQTGNTPGGCTSRDSCEAYCSQAAHANECIAWAKQNGLVESEEVHKLEKFEQLVASGQTPGQCNSKESCMQYCSDPAHSQECATFAEKMGFIDQEQEQQIQAHGFQGPGGCNSKDSCEEFCNQQQNMQICVDFAKLHGIIKPQDGNEINDFQEHVAPKIGHMSGHMPEEVKQCLEQFLSDDQISQLEDGKFMPTPDIAQQMKQCLATVHNTPGQMKPGTNSDSHKIDSELMQQCMEQFSDQDQIRACYNQAASNNYREGPQSPPQYIPPVKGTDDSEHANGNGMMPPPPSQQGHGLPPQN